MQLIYAYGFSVDADTKRIYLNEGKVAGFNQSIPQGVDGVSKGEGTGTIIAKNSKVGLDANNNLVYNDIKGKPYTGTVKMFGQLPHDENDKLLVDSVGAIKEYQHGLAFTVNGALAMDAQAPVIPSACELLTAEAVSNSKVNVSFKEPKTGTKPFDFFGHAVGGAKVIDVPLNEVAVAGTFFGALEGLTGGTTYNIYIGVKNEVGQGEFSNPIVVKTADGVKPARIDVDVYEELDKAVYFRFKEILPTPNGGYWVNIDGKEDKKLTVTPRNGELEATVTGLTNDQTYIMYLYAINDDVKGDPSQEMNITPQAPQVPTMPVITSVDTNDVLYLTVHFAPTDNGYQLADIAPLDITKWEVYIAKNGQAPEVNTINDGSARQWRGIVARNDGDMLSIWVKAYNAAGASPASLTTNITAGEVHLIDGGTRWSDNDYQYVIWYENGKVIVNYACRFDIFMVAGGGGGRGQLVPFGKGGNGGGGENKLLTYQYLKAGTYPITIGTGAQGGDTANGGNSTFPALEFSCIGGGTSQTKNNGTPDTPRTKVPDSFAKCNCFSWNTGVSDYVSGAMEWDKSSQPNGKAYGEGGGGTNGTSGSSKAGSGQDGIAVIRYPLPPLLPTNIRATQAASKTFSVIFDNPSKRVPAKWIVQPYINGVAVINKGKIDNTRSFLFLLDGSSGSQAVQIGDKVTARIYPDGYDYFVETPEVIWA